MTWAAKAVGVGRRTVYDHLQADPEFGERWQEALDTAAENLEGELIRRAVEGEQVPVYYKGKVVGHKTRKSDALLVFAIKNLQRRREKEVRKNSPLRRMFGGGGSTQPPADLRAGCGRRRRCRGHGDGRAGGARTKPHSCKTPR